MLILGLGNPGERYEWTLHNAGFLALDRIQGLLKFPPFIPEGESLVSRLGFRDGLAVLVKPQTFMNLSGQALQPFLGLPWDEIMVVHDELDLPMGRLKLKRGGGDGGHRGIRSLFQQLPSERFSRLRVGVGRPPDAISAADYVLEILWGERRARWLQICDSAASALLLAMERGVAPAMEWVNRRDSNTGSLHGSLV